MSDRPLPPYSAKEAYADAAASVDYVRRRFGGALGRYRYSREQRAVAAAVGGWAAGSTILDCPCGVGRWWPTIGRDAAKIIAVDISPSMLEAAQARAQELPGVEVELHRGDAEAIPLDDDSVDYAFCFALMKHLPPAVQFQVLTELARVTRREIVLSTGVFTLPSYALWRRRKIPESYPLLPEQMRDLADAAGLKIVSMRRATTPLGVERVVVLRCAE